MEKRNQRNKRSGYGVRELCKMKSFDSVSAKAIVLILMKVYIKSRTEVIKKIEKFDSIGNSNFYGIAWNHFYLYYSNPDLRKYLRIWCEICFAAFGTPH